jgi:integrase
MASIEPRGDCWRVVWRFDGRKQHTVPWSEREHAEQAKALAEAHHHRITAKQVENAILGETEEISEDAGPLYREWAPKWLAAKTRITPGTRTGYERQLENRIFPARVRTNGPPLGDMAIGRIQATDIGAFVNGLRAAGLDNGTITRYYSVLFGSLEAAALQGLIPVNPCRLTDFVRDQVADDDTGEEDHVYLTPDEFRLVRAAFHGQDRLLVDFLAGTGARWSEATATAVEHLLAPTPKAKPKVRIWRAWKRDGKGGRYLGSTKGRSKRTLPISATLWESLAPQADGKAPGALLFTSSAGTPLDYNNFYKNVWVPAIAQAMRCPEHPPPDQGEVREGARGRCRDFGGVREDGQPCGARVSPGRTRCVSHFGPAPDAISDCDCPGVLRRRPTPHDLRHTHAAWLFSDPRMTPLAISRRLGHQQLSTTSEIYGGLMPDAEDAAVDALDDVMDEVLDDELDAEAG